MTTVVSSVRAELLRLGRWPATWVLVGIWFALSLMFGYAFNYLSYRSSDDSGGSVGGQVTDGATAQALLAKMMPDNVPVQLTQGMPMFGGALILILGALAVGSGYGWGTWKTVFTVGPRRSAVFGGTLGALALIAIGVVLATFALNLAAAVAIASAESQPLDWPTLLAAGRGIGSGLLIVGMWAAGGALLGTLTRGPALAVGLGLVWSLVVENLLRGVSSLLGPVEAVTNVLPGTAAGSLVGALGGTEQSDPNGTPGVLTVLDGGPAAILLGVYLVLFAVAALALTARRDMV